MRSSAATSSWIRNVFCRRRPCIGWTRNPGTVRLLGVLNAACYCEGLRTSGGQDGQVTSFGRLHSGHNPRICDCEWPTSAGSGSHIGEGARKGRILASSLPPGKPSHHSSKQQQTPSSLLLPSDKSENQPWCWITPNIF